MRQRQLLALGCEIDDFCQHFDPLSQQRLVQAGPRPRPRATPRTLREVLTIVVSFHGSPYRTFKHSYTESGVAPLRPDCPCLRSYTRFVTVLPRALVPFCPGSRGRGYVKGFLLRLNASLGCLSW